MNKLKGTLCAFCMIFSAIFFDSNASYKAAVLAQADEIETDLGKLREDIFNGAHPLVGDDGVETETNINNFLTELKYSPEDITKLKLDALGSTSPSEMQKALTEGIASNSAVSQKIMSSILDASLIGDIDIPYWYIKDSPSKPFIDVSEKDIDSQLEKGLISLNALVDFAHELRTVGYTATEFLELYSVECEDGKFDSERCETCNVQDTAKKAMEAKLEGHKDNFYTFLNVIRSIGNADTYKLMRQDLLYGLYKDATPAAANLSTADKADLFNFLHLFLQEAAKLKSAPEVGTEGTVTAVACNWLTKEITDLTNCYPKVVNTLVDMMYIAHVGADNKALDTVISQKKRHILSKPALQRLNQTLGDITVDLADYRLVGINDLRIGDDAYQVLGLDSSFVANATSFLLPVALLQNKAENKLNIYNGAPLLMASDIVYMVKNKKLPIVPMFVVNNLLIATYRTGYNLIKQSILIQACTHDGSYNSTGIATVDYGKTTNRTYAANDWDLQDETTIELTNNYSNLIIGELFSWYTAELDGKSISGSTRILYEGNFLKISGSAPHCYAFIIHDAQEVKNISNLDGAAYTPNTIYAGDDSYTNKHYIKLNGNDVGVVENEIKGETLVASLLNSSWAETMLRATEEELREFCNITSDTEILGIGKVEEFNTSGGNSDRSSNYSSTVHQLDHFREALQVISNYTFPGFQARENAYGRPLAQLADNTTCEFITEDNTEIKNVKLQDNTALSDALGNVGSK